MKKVLLLTAVLLASSMAMGQTLHGLGLRILREPRRHQQKIEEARKKVSKHREMLRNLEAKRNQGPCEIEGNDCREVADLLYAIHEGHFYTTQEDPNADMPYQIKEPYREKLSAMNLHITNLEVFRDGGTHFFISLMAHV